MKIALVHKRLDLNGGTERDLFRTAEGLRDLGHEVHLYCSEYGVPAPSGVVFHQLAALPLGRTARAWSLASAGPKLLRDRSYDVVVSFGRLLDADVFRCGGGTHRGFLRRMGEEGGAGRRFWQSISAYHRSLLALEKRQFAANHVKKIIAVSAAVKSDIMDNYAVADEKIVVLYNGVDQHRFHPGRQTEQRRAVRERWRIPISASVLLFVGSGFRRKGMERMIALWNSAKFAEFYLLIVGADARLKRYQKWADSVAPGRIIFAGRQDDIENYYAAADLLALLSVQEAFGNVVLEALAAGLPVLVSRDVGATEVLKGRLIDGIVNRPDDPGEVEAKLLGLMDRAKDPALSKEARRLGEEYSWDKHFRQLETILFDVCGRPSLARVS